MRYYLVTLFALLVFGVPAISSHFSPQVDFLASMFDDVANQVASMILSRNTRSIAEIKSHYQSESSIFSNSPTSKVSVLIVPGHEPKYGGAEYRNIKERDMAVELGQNLQFFLENNGHYRSFITRDAQSWKPNFVTYFKEKWDEINEWQVAAKNETNHLISVGSTTRAVGAVKHNSIPLNVALRLYGITKWANDNYIDITLHIHFNDNPGHILNSPGKHSGFAIYIPTEQYANSTTTRAVAQSIYKRLSKYNPISSHKGESSGIIEEPDLIAIGSNNTADSASLLIEYGYIYEPQFNDPALYSSALRDLAYQTYLGLQDFFDQAETTEIAKKYDTLILPYRWNNAFTPDNNNSKDVYALQTAFSFDNLYPPQGETKYDCPRTGSFGPCTKNSLFSFQNRYGITDESSFVGQKTINALNQRYSVGAI